MSRKYKDEDEAVSKANKVPTQVWLGLAVKTRGVYIFIMAPYRQGTEPDDAMVPTGAVCGTGINQ